MDGTFPGTMQQLLASSRGSAGGLLRTTRTMQATVPGTIVGLHASDSVRGRFTGVATAMQCTLAR